MSVSQKLVINYIRAKFAILSSISKRKTAEKAFQLFCTPQYRNRKKLPHIFEEAENIQFAFHHHKISGYRWNHPSENKLLILHGYESSVINFDRYVKPLIKKGYEVLAFDAPAHGRSMGKQINAVLYKEFILYIDKHYGPIKNFIAHSLGGLAIALALEEMKHDETYQVTLIAPATETTTAIDSFFKFLQLDGEVRREFDDVIKQEGGHPPEWFSIARAAQNIKAKVLWLQDEDDQMTPMRDVKPIIEKEYPNFQFLISQGLGHRRIYRDNNSYKAIIDFFHSSV
ncbi:alpha/beta hydrolase [Chitinophagaceae bacterium LB-8]|uniref:Alpha/beta hydrolase n=1 Tax=Paraflavisolibacter caeni TaxID=2982496 RepID=A0A9X2XZF2_9BACT|nr:alpha/beta hydrolase [Paraflavisolibacter caeni]MCU7551522.1 alpha/beta hydrolase [Paraflavisolibacter caeni]